MVGYIPETKVEEGAVFFESKSGAASQGSGFVCQGSIQRLPADIFPLSHRLSSSFAVLSSFSSSLCRTATFSFLPVFVVGALNQSLLQLLLLQLRQGQRQQDFHFLLLM